MVPSIQYEKTIWLMLLTVQCLSTETLKAASCAHQTLEVRRNQKHL